MKAGECKLVAHSEVLMGKSVKDAAKLMKKENARYIYVTKDKMPMGIISSIDIVHDVVAEGKSPEKTKVEEVMKSPIHACMHDDSLKDVYMKMAKFNLFAMPVLKANKIEGVLTSHEVMRSLTKKGVEHPSKQGAKKAKK